MLEKSDNMKWWKGKTLYQTRDKLKPPKRLIDLPLRLPISDIYLVPNIGMIISGKVETGIIKPGMAIKLAPSTITTKVISIETHH